MLKKLIEIVKGMSAVEWLIVAFCAVTLIVATVGLVNKTGSYINEHRINAIETEKQQALQRADRAEKNELILQGQIQAKDEVIKSLTSQIEESNQRVDNAHKETQSARNTVQQVRSNPAKFNSTDNAGRILELGTELRGLYPDSP